MINCYQYGKLYRVIVLHLTVRPAVSELQSFAQVHFAIVMNAHQSRNLIAKSSHLR